MWVLLFLDNRYWLYIWILNIGGFYSLILGDRVELILGLILEKYFIGII